MLIPIDRIKPSPNPVRKTWDEDKMNELAQSIKEQGVIVPIKVREVCPIHGVKFIEETRNDDWSREYSEDERWYMVCKGERPEDDGENYPCSDWHDLEYEIVYGHRRVEAAKRAGLDSIEAWIDGVDDNTAHTMAGLENLVREGMQPLDVAEWVKKEVGKGKTQKQVGALVGKDDSWASRHLSLLSQSDEVKQLIKLAPGQLRERHIRVVRNNVDDPADIAPILKKTLEEDLGWRQTERIAKATKAAPSPQAKKKLLEWEYSPTIHDPELIKERAKKHGAHDPIYRDNKPSPADAFDSSPEIKMILDGIKMSFAGIESLLEQVVHVAAIGKLAPEGKQFIAHRLTAFRDKLNKVIEELEDN